VRQQDPGSFDDLRQAGLALDERQAPQILAVEMNQIECIEDHGMPRVCRAVLQRLKRRLAVRVDGHDLAVQHRAARVELHARVVYARICRRQILIVPGA
jgi:hypothetical protein